LFDLNDFLFTEEELSATFRPVAMKAITGGKTLTSREAARLLGVSEASVKRWADGGLLPALKTAGGHRRFRPEDVAAFRRARFGHAARGAATRAQLSPDADAAPDTAAAEASIFDALVAGDAEGASSVLVRLHLAGLSVGAVADAALCPAMRRVGDLWHAGQLSVAEEHVATQAAHVALAALRGAMVLDGPKNLTALCCSVEDDFHDLPVEVTATLLEARGWEVVVLGASMPFYALAEAVGRFRPRLVCAAAAVLVNPDRAAREYAEFRAATERAGAAVALGGGGFSPGPLRPRFPAELHADGFTQLEEFAASIEAGGTHEGD
jgi:MerR family transcriptional regulator, light-induced transcriptional regulator